MHEVFGQDDAATDEEIDGNVAESKSSDITSLLNQLHPIVLEDCSKLGKVVKVMKYWTLCVNLMFITTMFFNT